MSEKLHSAGAPPKGKEESFMFIPKFHCYGPWMQYKTYDLKYHLVFIKIQPPTGQITFTKETEKLKLFYNTLVGCPSRDIEGTDTKIYFIPCVVYFV